MARRKRATLQNQDALVTALTTLTEAILDRGRGGASMGECTAATPWGQCGASLPDGTLISPHEYMHAVATEARTLLGMFDPATPSRRIAQQILADRLKYLGVKGVKV